MYGQYSMAYYDGLRTVVKFKIQTSCYNKERTVGSCLAIKQLSGSCRFDRAISVDFCWQDSHRDSHITSMPPLPPLHSILQNPGQTVVLQVLPFVTALRSVLSQFCLLCRQTQKLQFGFQPNHLESYFTNNLEIMHRNYRKARDTYSYPELSTTPHLLHNDKVTSKVIGIVHIQVNFNPRCTI